ncbi:MAG: hypothetical protein Q9170_007818 [Blastenia crenularia]
MATPRVLHALARPLQSTARINGSKILRRRGLATAHAETSTLPLAGIRVLDMTRVLAGVSRDETFQPLIVYEVSRSYLLVWVFKRRSRSRKELIRIGEDNSAEIIKIEHPTRGDDTRAWGPPYAKHVRERNSDRLYKVNRNKKSIGLSFAEKTGQDILHKLAKDCDVLVENYLPDTLKKYQMDFQSVHNINPSLIYASITGYGQTGPYRRRAGYDVMVEAEMGLMHITGSRDGPPVKVGVAVTDLTTGLYTSNSIMAALLARVKTGKGQHIDVALSDCQVATLSNIASSALISGQPDSGRWGTSHPSIVPYQSFKTQDGDILLGGGNDRLFGILCDKLGKSEWKSDKRFNTNSVRVANRVTLEALIEAETRTRTTGQWQELLNDSGMPYAAVNDIQATLNHEHVLARDMVKEVEHPTCGPMKLVNTPVKYSHSEPSIRTAPPTLGQHTDEILSDILGMTGSDISGLRNKGVVS